VELAVLIVREGKDVDLEIWLPGMCLLGVVAIGLCYAFLVGCEQI
jgi:hypothetical protein